MTKALYPDRQEYSVVKEDRANLGLTVHAVLDDEAEAGGHQEDEDTEEAHLAHL